MVFSSPNHHNDIIITAIITTLNKCVIELNFEQMCYRIELISQVSDVAHGSLVIMPTFEKEACYFAPFGKFVD